MERFALVFDKRIALTIGTKVHTVAEIVHGTEVVLPLAVNGIEEHSTLHERKHLLIFGCALRLIGLFNALHHEFACRLRLSHERTQLFLRDGNREHHADPVHERTEIAFLCVKKMLFRLSEDNVVHDIENRVMHGLLVATKDRAAKLVDDRTLLVHYIIVLKRTLADGIMLLLDTALGGLYGLVQPAVLHHLAFLNTETEHDAGKLLGSEKTHQLIFKRDEELR